MAIQISGTTVINDQKELSSGLASAYDTVTVSATGGTITNRTVYCVTAAGQTITLPASPSAGNEVVIINGGNITDTVIARNGQNIMGLAENMTLDKAYAAMTFIFTDATRGWRII